MEKPTCQVSSVSNAELYARWAKSYDTDGNILQAIDDLEIPELLNEFFRCLKGPQGDLDRNKVTELGCGTGRNTVKLIEDLQFLGSIESIHGLDLSNEMINIAQGRCEELSVFNSSGRVTPKFSGFDALKEESPPTDAQNADGVISTLVLEHLPISVFFETVKGLLKKGGYLLLTNMHDEMGRRSQAGFLDVETGEKIRGDSFVYSIDEVTQSAEKWGFTVVGKFKERGIEEEDIPLVGKRGKKWLGCKVWFGCVMRYEG